MMALSSDKIRSIKDLRDPVKVRHPCGVFATPPKPGHRTSPPPVVKKTRSRTGGCEPPPVPPPLPQTTDCGRRRLRFGATRASIVAHGGGGGGAACPRPPPGGTRVPVPDMRRGGTATTARPATAAANWGLHSGMRAPGGNP